MGTLDGTEVVGFPLGEEDGWLVGEEVRSSVGEALGSTVGLFDEGPEHDPESQRHKSGNSDATAEHASASAYPWALCSHAILAPQLYPAAMLSHTSCVQESQPQYGVPSWIEGDGVMGTLEGTEVVGLLGDGDSGLVGEDVGNTTGCVGNPVGFFVGTTDDPTIAHDPSWHIPKGTELHGVESGRY